MSDDSSENNHLSDYVGSDEYEYDDIIEFFAAKEWVSSSTMEKKAHRQSRLRYLDCKSKGKVGHRTSVVLSKDTHSSL